MKKLMFLFAIAFFPPMLSAQDDYPDDVVIVLDCSGSMAESFKDSSGKAVSKMQVAKEALYEAAKEIPKRTNVGLVSFSAKEGSGWVYPIQPIDPEKLRQAVNQLTPGFNTPLGDYMKIGADALLERWEKRRGYGNAPKLVVISDGLANRGVSVSACALDITSRGITLHAIGVDMKDNDPLAKLAHTYQRADDPEAFKRSVKKVLAEVPKEASPETIAYIQDLVDGFPDEAVVPLIGAIAKTGFHPILTKPKPKPQPVKSESVTQPVAKQDSGQPANASPPTAQPAPSSQGKSKGVTWLLIVLGLLIAVFVIGGLISSASRPKRRW